MSESYQQKQWELDSLIDNLSLIEYTYDEYKKEVEYFIDRLLEDTKEINVLRNQLQQKENIIKEVREWAKKYSCQFTNDDGELVVSEISFNIQARPCDLFKILDKEVN